MGKKIKITPENKCSFCTASKCCTYVTQQIDTPRSKDEFETLLWQVSHENVSASKMKMAGSSSLIHPVLISVQGACAASTMLAPRSAVNTITITVNMMLRPRMASTFTSLITIACLNIAKNVLRSGSGADQSAPRLTSNSPTPLTL